MANNEKLNNLVAAIASARKNFDDLVARAEAKLEAHRNEHRNRIARSEEKVAALESELELLEALEQERRAGEVRKELASAIAFHQLEVQGANNALAFAVEDYGRTFACAGAAMEAGLNCAAVRMRDKK